MLADRGEKDGMKLTALTCTYNRPVAFALCEKYLKRQTRQPDQWLILDGPEPMGTKVLNAIESGKIEGDAIVVVEDDDYYFPTWLEWCEKYLSKGYEIVGQGNALYYQVAWRWYSNCQNVRHASLCQTAFSKSMLEPLVNIIKSYDNQFFDTRLWRLERSKYLHLPKDGERLVIGMKGLPGTKGYSGEHSQINPKGTTPDRRLKVLREIMGEDAENYRPFYLRKSLAGPKLKLRNKAKKHDLKIEVHILTYNEEEMLPYTLRHYTSFAHLVRLHDAGSTDRTLEIAKEFGADVQSWDTKGELNDELSMSLKNSCWKETDADWVIVVDCDELVYFPKGAQKTLEAYSRLGIPMVKTSGFDMYSETWPTTTGQIYDEVKRGAPSDKWYAKPALFSPKLVTDSGFGIGAHEARCVLKNSESIDFDRTTKKTNPPTYLLHFAHGIGPPERVAAKLDAKRARLSKMNEKHHWGNFKPGAEHVQEKLAGIIPFLKIVIK